MREYAYTVMDVFAEAALKGNPLAVFHDARGLSDQEMQALARELNLAETTFIVPEDADVEHAHGVRVRIFTVEEELEFAGHPTLGTASWLHLRHSVLGGAKTVTLRLKVGDIPVRFATRDERPGVYGTMQQRDPVFGAVHDVAAVAKALGMRAEDIDAAHPPQTVSTGMAFCVVKLASMEAIGRLSLNWRDASAYLATTDAKFFYCIARTEGGTDAAWHARMQFYNGEDPATGSAAGCAISWLVKERLVESATPVVIEQGVEMLRDSRITAEATLCDGSVNRVLVSGRTIPVAEGRFFL